MSQTAVIDDALRQIIRILLPAIEGPARADERAKTAEEVARAIEVKQGRRCPECQGKAGSSKPNGYFVDKRCGAGHTWTVHEHWTAHDWADIARQHAQQPPQIDAAGRDGAQQGAVKADSEVAA